MRRLGFDWRWAAGWSAAFAANLPLPLLFGLKLTYQGGGLGLIFGVLILWAMGLVVCARPARLRQALVRGAAAVALTQPVAALHIAAGMLAIRVWELLSNTKVGLGFPPGPESEAGALAVTLLTAQPFVALAVAGGYLLCWLFKVPRPTGEDEEE